MYRPVPVPPAFLDMLNMAHNIRAAPEAPAPRQVGSAVALEPDDRMVRDPDRNEGSEDRRSTRHAQASSARLWHKSGYLRHTLERFSNFSGTLSFRQLLSTLMRWGPEKRQLVERMWK